MSTRRLKRGCGSVRARFWLFPVVILVMLLPAYAGNASSAADATPLPPPLSQATSADPSANLRAGLAACPGAYDVYTAVRTRYQAGQLSTDINRSALYGAYPKASILAGFANKVLRVVDFDNADRLGWLLTQNTMPRYPGNPYVQLTRDYNPARAGLDNVPLPEGSSLPPGNTYSYEEQLADKIAASAGGLQYNDVMVMALDVAQGDYPLATLIVHNFLKELTYTTRQEGDGRALVGWDLNDRGSDEDAMTGPTSASAHDGYVILDSTKVQALIGKLANLRPAGDPIASDKMGPWYHFYGVLFLGAVTSGNTSSIAAWTENALRYVHLGSGRDAFKEGVNSCAGAVARAIGALPPACGSGRLASPLADLGRRGFDQTGSCSSGGSEPHLSDLGCDAAGGQATRPLNCTATSSGTVTAWTWQTDPNDNATPSTGSQQSFTTTFPTTGTKLLTVFACNGAPTVPNDLPGECDFFVGPVAIGAYSACNQWDVTGSWTLYLQIGSRGANSRPQLSLTQTGTSITGSVTSDPAAPSGNSKVGTAINGSICGSTATLNLPWDPTSGNPSDTLQQFKGSVDSSVPGSGQIKDTNSFPLWTMSGPLNAAGGGSASGPASGGSTGTSSGSTSSSGTGTSSASGGSISGGTPATTPANPASGAASSGASCSRWSVAGSWQLTQSNNYHPTFNLQQNGTTISGTVRLSADDQAKGNYVSNSGTVTGTLNGNQIQFTTNQMAKRDGTASQAQYTGTVVQGQITSGQAQDLLHPGSTATWTASGPSVCAASGSSAGGTSTSQPSSSSGSGSGGGQGCFLILGFEACIQP